MKRAPFDLQWAETSRAVESQLRGDEVEEKGGVFCISGGQKRKKEGVLGSWKDLDLDPRSSPSPPSSNSTLSSLGGSTETKWPKSAAVGGEAGGRKEENAAELHQISAALEMSGIAGVDWDSMLSEYGGSPGHEQAFLRLMMNDCEDNYAAGFVSTSGYDDCPPVSSSASAISFGFFPSSTDVSQFSSCCNRNSASAQPLQPPSNKNLIFSPEGTGMTSPSLPAVLFRQPTAAKQEVCGPNILLNQHQQTDIFPNTSFFPSLLSLSPSSELQQNSGYQIHLSHSQDQTFNSPQLHPFIYQQQHQQAIVDMLIKGAELVEAGIFVSVHGILARLNHHLPSPLGKPLLRSAFYFKKALELLANSINPQAGASSPFPPLRAPFITSLTSPLDVVLKLDAYKAFSEVSPIVQFTSFTATQALLEELNAAHIIHIIDFDIGVGSEWSSFMKELAKRQSPRIHLLKITAFVSSSAFHPLELHLIKENLSQFAADLNIPFEINISVIEAFNPAEILILSAGSNEAIAVNLPVGACHCPSFPILLCHVKQLLPKIVISVDNGCNRGDLHFSHHFLHALQSTVILLDSIDATGTNLDVANKIEKFVLQPKIDRCVTGRYYASGKALPWRTQFTLAGFEPVQFSNFSEMQAHCLLKRLHVRGFHVEKQHSSLYLYWKRGELASISIWRCK